MAGYSGNGVDMIARAYLPPIGMACDVGANDGLFLSNSLWFEEAGWTVLCIEPNPALAEAGRKRRKLWRQVAIGAVDSEGEDFLSCGDYPHASGSSLASKNATPQHVHDTVQVPVRRLDRVLEEAGFHKLDYLTIDVEGWEPEVMAGFTLERWKPQVIALESWKDDFPTPEGYQLVRRCEFDNIYVREAK